MAILSNINGKFAVDSTGAIQFSGAAGTADYVLVSGGASAAPTWVDVDTIIGGPYLPLTGGTLAGAGNLVVGGTLTVNGIGTFNTPAGGVAFNLDAAADNYGTFRLRTNGNANKWDIGMKNDNDFYIYNQATSAQAFEIDTANNNATFTGAVTAISYKASDFINIQVNDAEAYWTNTANTDYWRWKRDANNNFKLDHYNGSATNNALTFDNTQNATFAGNVFARRGSFGTASNFNFDLYCNGNAYINDELTVDDNATFAGNVGIGGAPSVNFEVNKTGARVKLIDGTNQLNMGLWDSVNYRFEGDANRPMFFTSYQGNINFGISGGTTMTIQSGKVGIGTTSPTTALSVSDGASMYANSNYLVQIKRNATNGNDDTSKASILLANNSNAFQIAYGGTTDRLRFINGGATEQMTLLNGGNVGIATSAPVTRLEVDSSQVNSTIKTGGLEMQSYSINNSWYAENLYYDGVWRLRSAGFATQMYMETGTISFKRVASGSAGASVSPETTMRLHSSGNIGINMTGTPNRKLQIEGGGTYPLSVNSTQRYLQEFKRSGVSEWWIAVDNGSFIIHENGAGDKITVASGGTLTAAGDLVAYSDERLKSNIKTLDGSKVLKMRGVSFEKEGKKGSGVIAQELEKIAPELVNNDNEYKGVAYGNLTGYLIEAIKELEARVKELENK